MFQIVLATYSVYSINTPDRGQSKMLILSTNVDLRLLETELLIANCRLTGDKRQTKTLFPAIFDLHSSLVYSFSDCRLFSRIKERILW